MVNCLSRLCRRLRSFPVLIHTILAEEFPPSKVPLEKIHSLLSSSLTHGSICTQLTAYPYPFPSGPDYAMKYVVTSIAFPL